MNNFNYDLYKISWEDICSDSGWASDIEFDKLSVSHCISIGFIFKKTQKYLWIFSSYEVNDLGEVNFGDRTVIPLSNITKMEKIYGQEKTRNCSRHNGQNPRRDRSTKR